MSEKIGRVCSIHQRYVREGEACPYCVSEPAPDDYGLPVLEVETQKNPDPLTTIWQGPWFPWNGRILP